MPTALSARLSPNRRLIDYERGNKLMTYALCACNLQSAFEGYVSAGRFKKRLLHLRLMQVVTVK